MIKIDRIQMCNRPKINPAFTSKPDNSNQISNLSAVTPDYNVKVPMTFQKSGEVELPYGFKAHMFKLANGQRVVIIPKEGETVLKTYVSTGSMNEPDNLRGISHYIEHNLFNGSNGLDAGEFFKTVNKMGAETNASTGFAETNYYISSNLLNKDDLEKKIKIHASMLETPKFALEMLEKEKGIVNSEINMITSNPDNIAINTVIKNLFGIKSTSLDLIGGTTSNITNLTRDDVINYYNNNYFPSNMITVVTGEVDPDKTIQLISKYFSAPDKTPKSRKFETLHPTEKTIRQDITSDKATAVNLALGFKGANNNDAFGQICMDAVSELLMSPRRLNNALRKFNTNADIMVEKISSKPDAPCAYILFGETNEQNSQKVLQEFYNQIYSLISNPPSEDEMQTIKKALINKHSKAFEFSRSINNLVGTNMLNGSLNYVTDYEKIVNSLTKDDIVNTVKTYLDLNKASIAMVHPKKSISFTGLKSSDVKRYRTANNYEIVTNPIRTNNSSIMITYQTPEKINARPAAAVILDKILQEGSALRDYTKFNEDLSKDGINLGFASTSNKISIACNAQDVSKALNYIKEVISAPGFSQKNLDFAKKEIKSELEMQEKSADDKLYKELFDGLEAGYTKEDILKDLDSVTLDEVKELYNHIISTSQAAVSVCSNTPVFDEINSLPLVKPFNPFLKDTFKPVEETKVLTDIHDKNQAQVIEAFKFKTNHNLKEDTAIELLNIILGSNASSRLFNDLREKQQLAYRVNSKLFYVDDSGVLKLQIGTTTENKETGEQSYDNLKKSIEGFNSHINKLKTEKVTQEELDDAKLYLKNQILNNSEDSNGKAISLLNGLLGFYGALKDNETLKIIDTITTDDIYNMASYIFSQKPTYSVLATENTLKANKDYLSSISNPYKM